MGRIKFQGGALMAPVPPALITCGTLERPNVMTAAWTGIINTKPPKTYVSIRPERYSHELIAQSGELVINLTTAALVRTADFCGVRSGRDLDKFEKCGITAVPSTEVSAPTLADSPLSIECRVFDVKSLGSHDMFLLDVVAVTVREELLDEKGKLHLEKCGLAAYAHGDYFALGKKIGDFGFSVRKKKRSGQNKSPAPKAQVSPEENLPSAEKKPSAVKKPNAGKKPNEAAKKNGKPYAAKAPKDKKDKKEKIEK